MQVSRGSVYLIEHRALSYFCMNNPILILIGGIGGVGGGGRGKADYAPLVTRKSDKWGIFVIRRKENQEKITKNDQKLTKYYQKMIKK